jgi:anaerobic magnesium-protoporphyrin IX monomethyl ester cyclase
VRILFLQTNTYQLLNPFPMGASLVASRLARAGHEVRFVDLMRERAPLDAAVAAATSFAPELACYSIRNRDNMDPRNYLDPIPGIAAIVRAIKQVAPQAPALLGGTAFTTFPSQLLAATGADYGMAGDDLEPIARFVASLAGGKPDLETPGLVYRAPDGRIAENPFTLVGYRDVRFDGWGLVDRAKYRKGFWQAGVVTRSGCPERCVYCDTFRTFGRSFVLRDPRVVAEEILALKRERRVRSVWLVDAGFNRPLDHAKSVLREILRVGAQVTLNAVFDPGEGDREFFELFRRAGGLLMMMFAESMSDRVLEALDKPFRVADMRRDAAELHRAKIVFGIAPTLGSPGETKETALTTLREVPTLRPFFSQFGIGWRIQPRTPLRDRAVAEGLLLAEDDCYTPHFYVSPETPKDWLEQQVKRHTPSRLASFLRMVPLFPRFAQRPWRRGPEDPDRPA